MVGTCACSTTKNLEKSGSNVDSGRVKDLEDSLHVAISERNRFEQEIKQWQYGDVEFGEGNKIDTTNIYTGDSIGPPRIINNTFEIGPMGIKATGNIKSAHFSSSTEAKIITEQSKLIDSFRHVKQKESYWLRTVTYTTTKHVKKTFIPFWVWLIIGGLVIFNFRKQIKSLI